MSLAKDVRKEETLRYERHQPEQTLLYQIIEKYYPQFLTHMTQQDTDLPMYVRSEFEEYLKCGRLEHGFLRVRCEDCHNEFLVAFSCKRRGFCPSCGARRMAESAALLVDDILPYEPIRQWVLSFPFQLRFLFASYPQIMGKVLGIVYRTLATHITKKAGYNKQTAKTGAVTLIQRFGSALNLNIHFHMLFLDGVYVEDNYGKTRFHQIKAPKKSELNVLAHRISQRVAGFLEREGLLVRDIENDYLSLDGLEEDPMLQIYGYSITYRIATGSQQGRKVFTLQTIAPKIDQGVESDRVANVAGFNLHAGVMSDAQDRNKLERVCRYITRSAVSEKRLAITTYGKIRYQLKTPYRDGTTHVIFEPLDFIARLATLVPKPRVNLTRFHGVFAPNSKNRAEISPNKAKQRKQGAHRKPDGTSQKQTSEKRKSMTWAQRLKRVFGIDIETCHQCGGVVKIIASIEDPVVIEKILSHLHKKNEKIVKRLQPESRAPPQMSLFE